MRGQEPSGLPDHWPMQGSPKHQMQVFPLSWRRFPPGVVTVGILALLPRARRSGRTPEQVPAGEVLAPTTVPQPERPWGAAVLLALGMEAPPAPMVQVQL